VPGGGPPVHPAQRVAAAVLARHQVVVVARGVAAAGAHGAVAAGQREAGAAECGDARRHDQLPGLADRGAAQCQAEGVDPLDQQRPDVEHPAHGRVHDVLERGRPTGEAGGRQRGQARRVGAEGPPGKRVAPDGRGAAAGGGVRHLDRHGHGAADRDHVGGEAAARGEPGRAEPHEQQGEARQTAEQAGGEQQLLVAEEVGAHEQQHGGEDHPPAPRGEPRGTLSGTGARHPPSRPARRAARDRGPCSGRWLRAAPRCAPRCAR